MFRIATFALFCLVLLWFWPITHEPLAWLDESVFKTLNGTLSWGDLWLRFWGALNHRAESKFSFFFTATVHIITVVLTPAPKRRELMPHLLFLWCFYEVIYVSKNYFFETLLDIKRLSPSLVFKDETLYLSKLLGNHRIKDISTVCFPSGHTLFSLYWGIMSYKLMPSPYNRWALGLAVFMSLPRMISGAHWFSDVVFAALLAPICFAIAEECWRQIYLFYQNTLGKRLRENPA
jgi:Kdo2-lipid A phosphotransferase